MKTEQASAPVGSTKRQYHTHRKPFQGPADLDLVVSVFLSPLPPPYLRLQAPHARRSLTPRNLLRRLHLLRLVLVSSLVRLFFASFVCSF